ncbi:MAG: Gfo/Idh/MocA family oxidoreductase [Clostridia bacterium]|nr:Gfo/Idh/MocA family oxidoreductase [Clostridia bacterium]
MLRIAMISKWHVHAKGYAQFLQKQEDAEIVCVWDEDAARGSEWAAELGVEFIADYDKVLAREDVDAVFIDSPTNMHKELMIKAARAGKHIFTEKVMALKVADCDEIIAEIEKAGVKFGISFPHRCMPRNLFVKEAVESGAVGDVTVLRVRNCHNGALANWLPDYWYDPETTGGGAMMDLGAHPMYLSSWILGKPTRITSMFNNKTPRPVEDNSVCTIEFENKAIAISETSLVSPMTPVMMEIYGTKGVILCVDDDVRIKTEETVAKVEGGWVKPKLPEELPHPVRQWIDGVLYGKEILFGTKEARALTELMEGAYIADKEGKTYTF